MYPMRQRISAAVGAVAALSAALTIAVPPSARAQGATAAAKPAAGAAKAGAAQTRLPALRFEKQTLFQVTERLSKESGVRVAVDKTLLTAPVTFQTIGGSLPAVLKELTAALPTGAEVKTTLLPAPGAAALDGDAIATLVATEEAMLKKAAAGTGGNGGGAVPILGALVPAEKAASVVEAMNLEKVYLLTNPRAAQDPVQRSIAAQTDALRNWMGLTPEQRVSAMDQQIEGLINMDPAARRALFSQQMELGTKFMQKIQSLPEGQRKQFWSDITGGRWVGSTPPPGGGGGTGGVRP